MKRQVILFTTCKSNFGDELKKYILNPLYTDIKNNDKYEFYVLYNKPTKNDNDLFLDDINIINFDNEYLIQKYNTVFFTPDDNFVSNYNTYYMIYEFYLTHHEYDHYWIIEDDVYFTSDWNNLFKYYENTNYDLICTHYYNKRSFPWNYNHINKILGKQYFNDDTFGLAFLPIARLSNNLINTIINSDLYYNVFQEVQVGSIVKRFNFSIDLMKKFHVDLSKIDDINRGSCSWGGYSDVIIKYSFLRMNNTIVHPIKKNQYDLFDNI
jgi:hypothetical protein